jgi:2-dehydro-3-deoxyphosphogluconate aldolase / (4S)-4-hydroxy-2-oxoglutarate aldolase
VSTPPRAPSAASGRCAITPQLLDSGVVAILRAGSGERVENVAGALIEAGITCLELTLTTPGALDGLVRVRELAGSDAAVGMGSVVKAADARAAIEHGADFLVSPAVAPEVLEVAARRVPCYPGGFTPTELLEAWGLGAAAVKLFPAASGGPRHLRAVRDPLPEIPLVPTGGVALSDIPAYLEAGAVAVGLGGPLLGDALAGGSLSALRDRASVALEAVAAARSA